MTNRRVSWDDRYAARAQRPYSPPDALLVAYAPRPGPDAPPPAALDLAAGLGQNALWLAAQGYRVDALDFSAVALARARAEAAARGMEGVTFHQADLEHAQLPEATCDLVCCFRYLNRALFPAIRAAVRPGGLVIYQTYNVRRLALRGGSTQYLLQPGELATHFPGWEVLHDDEVGELSRFVARRPADPEAKADR